MLPPSQAQTQSVLVMLWSDQKPRAHKVSSQSHSPYTVVSASSPWNSKLSCFNTFFFFTVKEVKGILLFHEHYSNKHGTDWWLGQSVIQKRMEKEKICIWKILVFFSIILHYYICIIMQHDQGLISGATWLWKFSSKSCVSRQEQADHLFPYVTRNGWTG